MGKPHSSRRQLYTRTKTGCLTCRERRKKCDEIKPICTGCERNFIQCKWPLPLPLEGPRCSKRSRSSRSRSSLPYPRISDSGPASTRSSPSPSSLDISLFSDHNSQSSEGETSPEPTIERHDDACDDKVNALIEWQPLTSSFISPDRAVLLTSSSLLLLQHYLEATSTFLVAKPLSNNPFVTLVLPLAYSDDLLMHAVLALSGTHLSFKTGGELAIQLATRHHYSQLLRSLRSVFAHDSTQDDLRRTSRLLLVLVVLCHVEAFAGEPHGGIFPHLRAGRELVTKLLQEPKNMVHDDNKLVQGFALEVYFYLVLVNSITPLSRDAARALPFDSFITSLEFLREYETFGVFFSCGQGLFETIPQISFLASKRLVEEESGSCRSETQAEFNALVDALEQWQSPPVACEMADWEAEHVWSGEIYRQALLIFIKTSMCGSVVNNPKVIVAIQRHIDIALPLFQPVGISPFVTLLLWPIMIIGSCLISESQRKFVLYKLNSETRVDIPQVGKAAKLLESLWADEDEGAYGPYGLHLVMRKHHNYFSMA